MLKSSLRALVFSGALTLAAVSFPSSTGLVHAKATGEIIGMVELGSGRVANAVVNLTEVPGTFTAPSEPVIMDQKNKEFSPHVLAILKGTKVRFNNSDPFFHNVFSSSRIQSFNVSQEKKGDISDMTFNKPGLIPIKCHIHSNMKAYLDVLPNPFFAVTSEKGLFQIGNVPAGTYTIKVWSENGTASTQSIEVPAGGRAKVIFKLAAS